MSDVANAEHEAPKPAKKRVTKHRRRHAAAAPKGPVKAPPEFAGMTEHECCAACARDKCVISGAGYCAHPMKGGLQSFLDRETLARYERARKVLAHRKIDA
jgi:hypothetical protein